MPLNKVNADSIADGTVVASDIADGTITLAKLQSGLLPPAIANSAAAYANAAFATANTGTASGSYANSAFATANTGTASGSYANSAFAAANSATATDATQNTNITAASTYANGAFAKANTAGVGTVTSIATGNGLTGGTITTSGTISLDFYTGSDVNNTSYPIGSYLVTTTSSGSLTRNASASLGYSSPGGLAASFFANSGTLISGTWRARGSIDSSSGNLFQRTA